MTQETTLPVEFEAWLQTHCDYDDLNKSEIELARDAWQAAIKADRKRRGEPVAGYTMVPVEPTPQMIAAFRSGFQNELHKNDRRRTMSAEEAGLRAMLKATPQPAEPVEKPYPVKLHAWGGATRYHDYEMSDGSIQTLNDTEAKELGWGRKPTEPVQSDCHKECVIGDSNYAAGMLLGWNLCIDNNEEKFNRIRRDRLRAAAQASHASKAHDATPQPAETVKMRPETDSEHIARDIREGRFPEKSDRKMVPAEPVKVPSDDLETLRMLRAEYDPTNGPMSALKAAALDAGITALLARYGGGHTNISKDDV